MHHQIMVRPAQTPLEMIASRHRKDEQLSGKKRAAIFSLF